MNEIQLCEMTKTQRVEYMVHQKMINPDDNLKAWMIAHNLTDYPIRTTVSSELRRKNVFSHSLVDDLTAETVDKLYVAILDPMGPPVVNPYACSRTIASTTVSAWSKNVRQRKRIEPDPNYWSNLMAPSESQSEYEKLVVRLEQKHAEDILKILRLGASIGLDKALKMTGMTRKEFQNRIRDLLLD